MKSLILAKNFLEDKHVVNFNNDHYDVRDAISFSKQFSDASYKFDKLYDAKWLQGYYGSLSIDTSYMLEELSVVDSFISVTYKFYLNEVLVHQVTKYDSGAILHLPVIFFDKIETEMDSLDLTGFENSIFFEGYEIQSQYEKRFVYEAQSFQILLQYEPAVYPFQDEVLDIVNVETEEIVAEVTCPTGTGIVQLPVLEYGITYRAVPQNVAFIHDAVSPGATSDEFVVTAEGCNPSHMIFGYS